MRYLFAIALLALNLTASAQTAKVIALSKEDAAKAELLYKQRDAADRAVDDFVASVYKRYVEPAKAWNHHIAFEFTDDYKYIVPAPFTFPAYATTYGNCASGTPAFTVPN